MSPATQAKLDQWLSSYWDSSHPADTARFYKFVWAVVTEGSNSHTSSEELIEQIFARYKGKREPEYLEMKAMEFASLYESLIEFVEEGKRLSYIE